MTQCERILNYIDRNGSITPIQALADLNVMRLAARINDLEKRGVKIRSETVSFRTVDGKPGHYARYSREA